MTKRKTTPTPPAPNSSRSPRSLKAPLKVAKPKKVAKRAKPYTVIRDDREKEGKGWNWVEHRACLGTTKKRLKTGDYTLLGHEGVLSIERKGSVVEFVSNLHQKRFIAELVRMEKFPVRAVILEFEFSDLTDWPASGNLPPGKLPKHLSYPGCALAAFWKVQMRFPTIPFIFAGTRGKEAASSLFKRVIEKYGSNSKGNTA